MDENRLFYLFRTEGELVQYLLHHKIDNSKLLIRNEPLFKYNINYFDEDLDKEFDVILITSPMSVRAILESEANFTQSRILIVGKHSAQKLSQRFKSIDFIAENIEDMINFITRNLKNFNSKRILYLRGNYITHDIKSHFDNLLVIHELEIYNIRYNTEFSEDFLHDLKVYRIWKMAFFSYKSIEEFLKICADFNLTDYIKKTQILVMNERAREIASDYCDDARVVDANRLAGELKAFTV